MGSADASSELEAAREALDLRVLEKELDGHTRRLVLAGEQHRDVPERVAVTLPLLKWFPDRALENSRESHEEEARPDPDVREEPRARISFTLRLGNPRWEPGLSWHAHASREHPARKLIFLEREQELERTRSLAFVDALTCVVSLWIGRVGFALVGGGVLGWLLGLRSSRWWAAAGALLVAGHLIRHAFRDLDESGSLRLSRYLPESPWTALLGLWTHHALVHRDPTMARRLDQAFVEDPELVELLAVVGNLHVPGMTHWLTTERGWVDTRLRTSLQSEARVTAG